MPFSDPPTTYGLCYGHLSIVSSKTKACLVPLQLRPPLQWLGLGARPEAGVSWCGVD